MSTYRLSWETVGVSKLWMFSDADPRSYKNTTQIVPNSQIPDGYWHAVSKEDSNPWQQYNQLKEWADQDREFIRNVRLEESVSEPEWREVEQS